MQPRVTGPPVTWLIFSPVIPGWPANDRQPEKTVCIMPSCRTTPWKSSWTVRRKGVGLTWPPLGGGTLVAVAGGMCQGEAWAWLRALALLLWLASSCSVIWASESPDRECCEPLYPFIPGIPLPTEKPALTTPALPPPRPTSGRPSKPVTKQPPSFVDVTIEQQEIATTRRRPG